MSEGGYDVPFRNDQKVHRAEGNPNFSSLPPPLREHHCGQRFVKVAYQIITPMQPMQGMLKRRPRRVLYRSGVTFCLPRFVEGLDYCLILMSVEEPIVIKQSLDTFGCLLATVSSLTFRVKLGALLMCTLAWISNFGACLHVFDMHGLSRLCPANSCTVSWDWASKRPTLLK